jgi:DNA-directed RNA polymerase specialized sigma24 family protein
MKVHDTQRVKTLFAQAADLPQEKRAAFLDAACRGEPDLRAELESLLDYDSSFESGQRDDSFLKSPLLVSSEASLRVQDALNSLDPIDREVLALRHFGQLGRAEAARTLGITQEEAAKRYFHALKRLKDALATLPGQSQSG